MESTGVSAIPTFIPNANSLLRAQIHAPPPANACDTVEGRRFSAALAGEKDWGFSPG
jgi:hypothetical protein